MIFGTILESKSAYTTYGREYRVQYDNNPEAKSMDGQVGTALSRMPEGTYKQHDRVELTYQTGLGYGLWFILGKEQ